jgi:hypothetical protein
MKKPTPTQGPPRKAPRGRPSIGLGGKKFELKLGPIRESRLKRRAAHETEVAMRQGLKRTFVSAGEVARRAVDLYLSLYPPPGDRPEPMPVGEVNVLVPATRSET